MLVSNVIEVGFPCPFCGDKGGPQPDLPVAAPDHADTIRRALNYECDGCSWTDEESPVLTHISDGCGLHGHAELAHAALDALLVERQQREDELEAAESLAAMHAGHVESLVAENERLEVERQQDKERIERLREAVVSIDYPYPIDIFPDLQERDEVFAAMRAVNRYATEQFASEIARQRGTAARTYLEDGDLPALAVEEDAPNE